MKVLLRLALLLSASWIAGCIVVAVIECAELGWTLGVQTDEPRDYYFFVDSEIDSVCVSYPELGEVEFPVTMARNEIDAAVRKLATQRGIPTNATISWDIEVEKPSTYWLVSFDWRVFWRTALIIAVVNFSAFLLLASTARWVVQGFHS